MAARTAAIAKDGPLVDHYDGARENRVKGAGFYTFSKEEGEREKVMQALKEERERTERERGRKEATGGVLSEKDREREERKRKVEEKRRELLEKRAARA
jgi:vacuolar-type H+-ATPase subunit I/STV1